MHISDDKIKLQFLNFLLETDDEIQEQFERFVSNLNNIKSEDFEEFVESIFNKLNFVDIDDYVDMCNFYDYYDEDICDEIAQDLLLEYRELIDSLIKEDNIYKVFWVILAIYKAIKKEPALIEDIGICYSYEESLFNELEEIIYDNIEVLEGLDRSKRVDILKLLVSKLKDNFDYKFFNSLFLNLIDSNDMAQYAKSYFDNFDAIVKLHILDILKEDEEYIRLAKSNLKDDNVAKILLERLYELDRYSEFEDIAKSLFEDNKSYWIDYLIDKVKKDKSPKFYTDLVKYRALHNDINRYIELKSLVSSNEIEEVLAQLKESYYYDYYIKILIYEQRFEELLEFVKANIDIDFSLYAKALVEVYPDEILKIVIKKCEQEMTAYNRSRNNYKKIAKMLLQVYNSSIKDELRKYINRLYYHKPRLPALQDELKRANLIDDLQLK